MANIIVTNGSKSTVIKSGSQMSGEKIPGDLESMLTYTTDANELTRSTYGLLSSRSSTLYHSGTPVTAACNKNTQYAIGRGLLFRSQPDGDILGMSSNKLNKWAKRFQKLLHYYYQSIGWYQKQGVLFRTSMIQGDSLLFFDRSEGENGYFDLIETGGDQIDWSKSEENITLGIKHDAMLRRKGIETITGSSIDFRDVNGDQNVIQFYTKEIARALRGYSIAYKMINLAKNHDRFADAIVQRAVLETIMFGTAETDTTNVQQQAHNMAQALKASKQPGVIGTALSKIASLKNLRGGSIFEVKSKEKIQFSKLEAPSNNVDKFNQMYYELAAMATDTPPEVLLSKYSTSFTAHKGALNDFIKAYMQKRATFEDNVCYAVNREAAKYFIRSGMLSAPGFFENELIERAWLAGTYLGPVPGHVNPVQEVTALEKAVNAGFMNRSQGAAQYGNEYDVMIERHKEEEERFIESSPEKKAEIMQNNDIDINGDSA